MRANLESVALIFTLLDTTEISSPPEILPLSREVIDSVVPVTDPPATAALPLALVAPESLLCLLGTL